MITLIAQVSAAIAAVAGLAFLIYRNYFAPAAKAKRQALAQGQQGVDAGDASGVTAAFDKLNKHLCIGVVAVLIFVCGCQQAVILHPIEGADIIRVAAGTQIKYADKEGIKHDGAPKDGYFLSDLYIKEVMGAKVQ